MVERTLISFPSQLQLIGRLQHLLYLSSSMVFISGEKGSGKSTLIERLSNQLPDTTQQAFIHLAEAVSAAQIRQKIISQLFEQPLFDADDTLFNSLMLLKSKQSDNVARVIVIDNAELLPEQLLHELANVIKQKSLVSDSEINFVLLSDELHSNQMLNLLKQPENNQAITALAFKLPPLDIKEANKLLTHCLTQVGYSAKIQHQDALAKQLLNCQGIPEKILQLATKVSSGHLESGQSSWFKMRFSAILLMLLLLAIVAGLGVYLYPKFIKPQQVEVAPVLESETVLLDEIHSTDLIIDDKDVTPQEDSLAGQWSNEGKVISDSNLSVGETDSEERTIIAGSQLLELEKSSASVVTENDERDVSDKQISDNKSSSIIEPSIAEVTIDSATEKSLTELNEEQVEPSISALVSTDNAVESQQVVQVALLETLKEEGQSESKNHKPFSPSDTLLAVDPNFYTLQLAAMSSEDSLHEFIADHQLADKDISIYQTVRNGGNWYVVIYGEFENYPAALREAKKLSNLPTQLDSWAKKYALVHQDLQLNEQ